MQFVEKGEIKTKKELNAKKIALAKKFSLKELPTNPDILKLSGKSEKALEKLFSIKPMRSLSGVNVVAIMTAPHPCPGKCIYCPSSLIGVPTPKSYTGREPSTMRALRNNFDSHKMVSDRIAQLERTGHAAEKIELIVMGGTFFSQPKDFRERFVLGALNAITGKDSKSIGSARMEAEHSKKRLTGLTFETRPDYCSLEDIKEMLWFGGTRCELGVQVLDDAVNDFTKRGHSIQDVVHATARLKNAGFKVCYHVMPGLPSSSKENDVKCFKKMFSEQAFKPDMLKIYPTLVMKGTPLYKMWESQDFQPLTAEEAADLIAEFKRFIPPWVRIMRIQRDIPANLIEGGVKKSNLRQLVGEKLKEKGIKCKCIRCREAGLKSYKEKSLPDIGSAELFVEEFKASDGTEIFVSFEDAGRETLFGFCRLRILPQDAGERFGSHDSIIRELRVFGESLPLGLKKKDAIQHQGFGLRLVEKAQEIASDKFDSRELAVISGLGVKEYYRRFFGFKDAGLLLSKKL